MIAAEAAAAFPAECCGLLVGQRTAQGWRVARAVAAANVAAPAHPDRFEVDPRVHFATLRAAAAEGLAVIGHYHSHPNAAAVPSAVDAAHAFEPDHVWVIVPIADGVVGQATAWQPQAGGGFCAVPLAPEA